MLWIFASALAAELVTFLPDGPLRPGEPGRVGLWCEGCTVEAPPVVEGARVLGVRTGTEGATWVEVVAGAEARLRISQRTSAGSLAATVEVAPAPPPGLTVSLPAEAALADGAVEVLVVGEGLAPEVLRVRASEGTVGPGRVVSGGVSFPVKLSAERAARPLVVGVLDERDARAPAAFASTRLRARVAATLAAEPGARATLRIGSRSYGPFVAGADGTVPVAFDALPGEANYELTVSDDLGNTQKLVQPIPAVTQPTVLLVDDAGRDAAGLWIAAVDARGAPWSGAAPACRTGGGAPEPAIEVARARWRWIAARRGLAVGDVPVGCTLADVRSTGRLAAAPPEPAAIALRFYPDVLSADFPLAEVQASLIDVAGDRLDPTGLELVAAHGHLVTHAAGGALRAEYDGTAAAALGSDELRARWTRAPGSGPASRVEVCAARDAEGTVVVARVLDGRRRPLREVEATAWLGSERLRAVPTDARGYARWRLDAASVARRVRVESGAAMGEALARADAPGDPGCLAAASPDRADLDAVVRVPIRTGRVRQVAIDAEPRTLTLGPGASAEVRVRMLDGAGAPVRDEPVTIRASDGEVGPTRVEADGTVVAAYVPGSGADARTVTLTATSSAGTVGTSLEVVPRPVRGLVSAGFGWLGNFGVVSSPYGSLAWEHRVPVPGLSLRLGLGAYGVDETVEGEAGAVRTVGTFFPVDLGVSLTNRTSRFSVGASLSLVLVPYSLEADFGGDESIAGVGMAPPGVDARGSFGYRIGQTELVAEVGYLLYTAPTGAVSVAQNAGGLHLIVGYRLLY